MGTKKKLDMSKMIKELEQKTIKDPYWGTGGGRGGWDVNKMKPLSKEFNKGYSGKGTT